MSEQDKYYGNQAFETIYEKTKGCKCKDPIASLLFKFGRNIKERVSG